MFTSLLRLLATIYRNQILQGFDIRLFRLVHLRGDGFAFRLNERRTVENESLHGRSAEKEAGLCDRHLLRTGFLLGS